MGNTYQVDSLKEIYFDLIWDLETIESLASSNKTESIRGFFYGTYDSIFKNRSVKDIVEQSMVDSFYTLLFSHLKDEVFPKILKPLNDEVVIQDIVSHYMHPLNHYSYLVNHYANQLSSVQNINHQLGFLAYLNKLETEAANEVRLVESSFPDTQRAEIIELFWINYMQIIEFQTSLQLFDSTAIVKTPPLKFFKQFELYKQDQYHDRIKSAQVIYQSYLSDYQRIGVFLFLVQMVVFGFTTYQLDSDNRLIKPITKNSDPDSSSEKRDIHAVAVVLIAILALLVPLLREIKSGNIDPRKKYWMMSLSNWYSPSIVFPDAPPFDKVDAEKENEFTAQFENSTLYYNDVLLNDDSNSNAVRNQKLDSIIEILNVLKDKGVPIDYSRFDKIDN